MCNRDTIYLGHTSGCLLLWQVERIRFCMLCKGTALWLIFIRSKARTSSRRWPRKPKATSPASWARLPTICTTQTRSSPRRRRSRRSPTGLPTAVSSCGLTRRRRSCRSWWATTSSWARPRAAAKAWSRWACTSWPCALARHRITRRLLKRWSAKSSSIWWSCSAATTWA